MVKKMAFALFLLLIFSSLSFAANRTIRFILLDSLDDVIGAVQELNEVVEGLEDEISYLRTDMSAVQREIKQL